MSNCKTKNCNNEIFDKKEKKCILHCTKSEKNEWFLVSNNEKNWDMKKVNIFWKCIQDEMYNIYAETKYVSLIENEYIEYKKVIFPIFQKDIITNPYADYEDELSTNFYSYGKSNDDSYQGHNEVITIFNELNVQFTGCIFEGETDFRKYHFKKSFLFKKCIFNEDLFLSNIEFESDINFEFCEFKKKVNFSSSIFNKDVYFAGSIFKETSFKNVIFKSKARFDFSDFYGNCNFNFVTFNADTSFIACKFKKKLDICHSTFENM